VPESTLDAARMAAMRAQVDAYPVEAWVDAFLQHLDVPRTSEVVPIQRRILRAAG
jgi:hypothetical protein